MKRAAPLDMGAHIRELVAQAPPPSPEQINRLRLILWPVVAKQQHRAIDLRELLPGVWGPERHDFMTTVGATGHQARVILKYDDDARRYLIHELTLTQSPGRAKPITTKAVRGVAITEVVRSAVSSLLTSTPSDGREPWGLTAPRLADEGPTARALQWTAHVYNLGVLLEQPPTKFVEESLGLARTTAIRWVIAARGQGLIR